MPIGASKPRGNLQAGSAVSLNNQFTRFHFHFISFSTPVRLEAVAIQYRSQGVANGGPGPHLFFWNNKCKCVFTTIKTCVTCSRRCLCISLVPEATRKSGVEGPQSMIYVKHDQGLCQLFFYGVLGPPRLSRHTI